MYGVVVLIYFYAILFPMYFIICDNKEFGSVSEVQEELLICIHIFNKNMNMILSPAMPIVRLELKLENFSSDNVVLLMTLLSQKMIAFDTICHADSDSAVNFTTI